MQNLEDMFLPKKKDATEASSFLSQFSQEPIKPTELKKALPAVQASFDGIKSLTERGEPVEDKSLTELKAEGGDDKPANEMQHKVFMALAAAMPTVLGAALGGSEGGQLGAKATQQYVGDLSKQEAEEAKNAKELKDKLALKKLEIQADNEKKASDQEFRAGESEKDRLNRSENAAIIAGGQQTNRDIAQSQDKRNFAQSLRKEYLNHPTTQATQNVATSYAKIKSASEDPTAAGDLSVIYSYMKMLDPGSTVREGEFANAQNAAGIPTKIMNMYNKAATGERLSAQQRKDFLNQSKKLYDAQLTQQKKIDMGFTSQANKFKIEPAEVVFNPVVDESSEDAASAARQKRIAELRAKMEK